MAWISKRLLELCLAEEECLRVNVRGHPLMPLRPLLTRLGFLTSRELKVAPQGQRVKTAGRIVLVNTPPTKSGRRVMFVTAEDEYGLIDMVLFPRAQRSAARKVLSCPLCAFEGRVRRQGRAVSLVLDRAWALGEDLEALNEPRRSSTKGR